MQVHSIYGIEYQTPAIPDKKNIAGYQKLFTEQKWVREPLPASFEGIDFDGEGNVILTTEQAEFVNGEFDKFEQGYWFFNNGEPTYITGVHYFYLQYYILEDGQVPEYRDVDRQWFYYLDYCYKHPYISGIIRIKKRREGASSQAACFILVTALTRPQSNCGIVSKTKDDAKKVFVTMVKKAFNRLPAFLKPRVENEDSVTSLEFAAPRKKKKNTPRKGQLYTQDRGLESVIDYLGTTLNSYDSGRVTVILIDEAGKFPVDVPINQYWPIVKKTLYQGVKRVGFALVISTVNDAESGGAAYKQVWDDSNHFEKQITGTGLYRYFSPAYLGLPGFIDEYGHSIVENASPALRKMLKQSHGVEYTGAKDYLQKQRDAITDPTAKSEEIRMNPFDEREAFMISQAKCHFNVDKINNQIEEVKEKRPFLRRGKFYQLEDGTVDWMDISDGPWHILRFPKDIERNRRHMTEYGWAPANTGTYAMGIDPHRHSHTKGNKDLSKTAAWIGERLDTNNPDETGMPIAFYYDRPKEKSMMYDQMLFAGIFYGVRVHFETDAGDDYYSYYSKLGYKKYVRWTPTCVRDTVKPGRPVAGTSSRDPYALSKQLEFAIAFFEHHCHKIQFLVILEQALIYDHADRQIYDAMVAFMIMLIDMIGDTKPVDDGYKKKAAPIIATYNLLKARQD